MTRHACIHRAGRETATLPTHSYTQYIPTYVQSLWPVHTALSSESQCTLTFPEHSQSHHVGGVVLGVVLQEFLAHILPSRGGKTHQCLFVTFGKHIIGATYSTYISVTILGYRNIYVSSFELFYYKQWDTTYAYVRM